MSRRGHTQDPLVRPTQPFRADRWHWWSRYLATHRARCRHGHTRPVNETPPWPPPPPTRNREARTASLWPFPWHHLCVATSVTALVASCGCGDLPGPHPRLVPVKWWCHDEVGGALVSLGSSTGIPLLAGHLGPSRLPRVWVSFIVGFSGKHTFGSNGAYRMGRWHPW